MEFICSMTGKSPSTTGAGSEGALTKGPFNALPPIIDLNNALVSFILTGHHGFVTAAGYVGPKARVDHDVSLLVPEVWCRMSPEERDPQFLIANGYPRKMRGFRARRENRSWPAGSASASTRVSSAPFSAACSTIRTPCSPTKCCGRNFRAWTIFVDGMDNIVTTQKRVAKMYFDDGSIAQACPPLKALLHIMLNDEWEGKGLGASRIPQTVHARIPAGQRLVCRAAGGETED